MEDVVVAVVVAIAEADAIVINEFTTNAVKEFELAIVQIGKKEGLKSFFDIRPFNFIENLVLDNFRQKIWSPVFACKHVVGIVNIAANKTFCYRIKRKLFAQSIGNITQVCQR
jgi:hypothetical protein